MKNIKQFSWPVKKKFFTIWPMFTLTKYEKKKKICREAEKIDYSSVKAKPPPPRIFNGRPLIISIQNARWCLITVGNETLTSFWWEYKNAWQLQILKQDIPQKWVIYSPIICSCVTHSVFSPIISACAYHNYIAQLYVRHSIYRPIMSPCGYHA